MAETKTRPTDASVDDFIAGVANRGRREDAVTMRAMMERVTGLPAVMWGPSIIGFGSYHYRYASGHEGDAACVGFSPRAANMVVYVGGFSAYGDLLAKLGPHRTSVACLYLGRLAGIDMAVLEEIVRRSFTAASEGRAHERC